MTVDVGSDDFLLQLTTAATVGDLPGSEARLELSERGKAVGDYFHRHPGAPGVLLARDHVYAGAISRRYYLDMIGRYCGMDLYHPLDRRSRPAWAGAASGAGLRAAGRPLSE
jgi:hypothetical protein